MTKVHILPPDVISRIAAGEIIERPASVIKELVENSVDAGADSIEIHLENAGKDFISLKDNGHGIDAEDLEKIFFRHATSKIQRSEDLDSIASLGFRGEALYSIASIADVTLRSKTSDEDSGWEIHLRGGKKLDLRPCPSGQTGTEIEIRDLFYNTPARKKFLKTNSTEIQQILNVFIPYTLIHNEVRFRLTHQDRDLIDLAPSNSLISRVSHVLNLDETHIMKVEQNFPEKNYFIQMILGDINIKRFRRDMQFIFINDRPVQNKAIAYHLNQVYRLIMPEEIFPFFSVMIRLPPETIDVNIHPTKREVKIKNEQSLCSLLRSLCEGKLMTASQTQEVQEKPSEGFAPNMVEQALKYVHNPAAGLEAASPVENLETTLGKDQPMIAEQYSFPTASQSRWHGSIIPPSLMNDLPLEDSLQNKLDRARYIGSFINKYLIFEADRTLLLVDQHAAQERIVYEQLIAQMQQGDVEIQHLLTPVLINLTVQEMLAWEEMKERLDELGLSTSKWDEETVAAHTQPLLLKDVEAAIRHILAGDNIARSGHEELARRACRASIMSGDALTKEQAVHQKAQLMKCLDPFTCPHGRPTVIELKENFLDKQFLRK